MDTLSLPLFHPNFPLLLVIMKPLILVYCYHNEGHNVLDNMEVFPQVDLIIMKKIYDFYYVNTFIDLSDVYRWRSIIFTAGPFSSYVLFIMGPLLH